MLQFISANVFENLAEENNSHWESDYQLHLLLLLNISFRIILKQI